MSEQGNFVIDEVSIEIPCEVDLDASLYMEGNA